jgi:phage/plasmid-like protein (TIGR03299 family)
MSHEIDTSTGTAAIAFVRADVSKLGSANRGFHKQDGTPWHGLGHEVLPTDSIDVIRAKAGLGFEVLRAPAQYAVPKVFGGINLPELRVSSNRDVLFRSDTGADLGVVSRKGYKVHQPREIMDLLNEIITLAGFKFEVAGALHGGKVIWGLASAGEGANVIGRDKVCPYVLVATSFDGSMGTIGQWTAKRVVCNNTFRLALAEHGKRICLPHRSQWDADYIKSELGLVSQAFDQFLVEAKRFAEIEVKPDVASAIIAKVMAKRVSTPASGVLDITKTKGFQSIMGLFQGGAIGSDLTGGQTAWQLHNAFTQYVDHERGGRSKDENVARSTRLDSAWFGDGDALKAEAHAAILETFA